MMPNDQPIDRSLATRQSTVEYFAAREVPIEILIRSKCHTYRGKWTPEREQLSKTLEAIGAPPPSFDFRTTEDPDAARYADLKATPMEMSVSTINRRRREVFVSAASEVKGRQPHGLVPYRTACDELGMTMAHVSRLVASGSVKGEREARLVSLSSMEAYMATRS